MRCAMLRLERVELKDFPVKVDQISLGHWGRINPTKHRASEIKKYSIDSEEKGDRGVQVTKVSRG